MKDHDRFLEQRIRDIVAVATDDIDSILVEVEDGVAYIEGIVSSDEERRKILSAVRQSKALRRVITCLVTEHVARQPAGTVPGADCPAPVLMHYYSLS